MRKESVNLKVDQQNLYIWRYNEKQKLKREREGEIEKKKNAYEICGKYHAAKHIYFTNPGKRGQDI